MKITITKIMLLLHVITIGWTANAKLIRDEQGRTVLMNSIIETEIERERVLESQSWYITDKLYVGCIALIYGWQEGKHIDKIFKHYRVNRDNSSKSLLGNIPWFAASKPSQLDFKAKDNQGNTALNYCKTPEMFDTVRSCGAPFQYDAFLYAYRKKCIVSTIALGIAGCIAYKIYKN